MNEIERRWNEVKKEGKEVWYDGVYCIGRLFVEVWDGRE